MDKNERLLEISNLRAEYKADKQFVKALNGVNLHIDRGESLGLVGESGAGKTSTALSILRLLPKGAGFIRDGSITFDGTDILSASKKTMMSLRGDKISMIFQNPLTSLNPVFTIGEQIAMVLTNHVNISKKDALTRAGELLEMVGISANRLGDYPTQFSGGMRQRVGIASALACEPSMIIADEPTTALDVTIQAQILELIGKLQSEFKTALLMITHNLGIVSQICQNIAVMYAGAIIEYGQMKKVFSNPLHPYTVGLFNSIPKLEGKREPLMIIPGSVANALYLPDGCAFHPRCAHANDECRKVQPANVCPEKGHYVACHQFKEGARND